MHKKGCDNYKTRKLTQKKNKERATLNRYCVSTNNQPQVLLLSFFLHNRFYLPSTENPE